MVIDFLNLLRRGALRELENDCDEILVVKAQAYNAWYKVTCEVLAGRNVKLKISRNEEHAKEVTLKKEARVEKEVKKAETRRPVTEEDKIVEKLMKLNGGNRELALVMKAQLDAKAREIAGKNAN
jgi:hypothetical protein